MSEKGMSVGIDVGGTKILTGLWDGQQLSHLWTEPTLPGNGLHNLKTVRTILEREPFKNERLIGISVPTSIDPAGVLRPDDNFVGWGGYPLGRLLSTPERQVRAFADVECGAVAEAHWGAGKGARFMLYITVSTGVSQCYVVDGRPLTGFTASAYYCGYMLPARCAWPDCRAETTEDIISGPAIARAYTGSPQARDARPVLERAGAGDPKALEVIEHAAWHLGAMISDLIHIINPEIIVIGGGLGSAAPLYREKAVEIARTLVRPQESRDIPIVPAAFAGSSCCLGAAALACQ